ncbi:MAG: sodium-dependent bicarbonate transport family permease [Pseudomonadales bacterium]|nr:sodium-dependent bicarbonate transport family permease [Pseudomonadales bacterium]
MEISFLSNLTSPPLLFFILGTVATLVRTGLEIPPQVARFLSLYLLFAIGFKGGVALSANEIDTYLLKSLLTAVLLAIVVPLLAFLLLRNRLPVQDAAALAATYGSVSAVTFVTCTSYLDTRDIIWSGHMVAAMALMESPAIIVGLGLYRLHQVRQNNQTTEISVPALLHESFLNGSVFLVMGSMAIGWISGAEGMAQISPLIVGLFSGVLCLFLLDMGIVAARRLPGLFERQENGKGVFGYGMLVFALGFPLFNASVALVLAHLLGLNEGDSLLLAVLAASASYIAVPAALRLSLPEANPGLYLSLSLGVTFPFNIIVGIPLYHSLTRFLNQGFPL